MTTAISTNDPSTERAGGRCGWGIGTSLSRSTSLGSSLPFLYVMTSLPKGPCSFLSGSPPII